MPENQPTEHQAAADAAAFAAELAAINIKKYLELRGPDHAIWVKIIDVTVETRKVADSAAELAVARLQKYLQQGNQ
jgi:hypothetical protein